MNEKINHDHVAFKILMEKSCWGIMLLNEKFEVIYQNPAAEQVNGRALDKNSETSVGILIHPQDYVKVMGVFNRVADSPSCNEEITFRSKHFKGHYIWLRCNFTNMLNVQKVDAIVCNFIDVSAQKQIELQLLRQTEQVNGLLETIYDGFISLDENLYYTYLNKKALKLADKTQADLIGRHIFDVFPDAIGPATYQAIQTCFKTKKYICNQDFHAPSQLWYENRIYFSAGGITIFIRDITKQKKEEHRLKLLESVITNATDAVLITDVGSGDSIGQRILYVNDAFTQMTGYTADDVIGKSPRTLQGRKTDRNELDRIGQSLRAWLPCEATVINYKKNGEEFWINFILNPVADEKGWFTHWIAIERDVTQIKIAEFQKALLFEISQLFAEPIKLHALLKKLMQKVVAYDHFEVAEIWLTGADRDKITLVATSVRDKPLEKFDDQVAQFKNFSKGESLPGAVWERGEILEWVDFDKPLDFLSNKGNRKLKIAYGIPLLSEKLVIGVLVIALAHKKPASSENLIALFKKFSVNFGAEISRKKIAEELFQIFNRAPDIICVVGNDGYLKKVNPAMGILLGYTDQELLSAPLDTFIHPDDLSASIFRMQNLLKGEKTLIFDNRFISKNGKTIWLSWTGHVNSSECLLYCVAKDITEKIQTEQLLSTSESKLMAVFENTDAFIYSLDLNLRYVTFNSKFIAMMWTDYHHEVISGAPVFDFSNFSNSIEVAEWNTIYKKAFSGEIVQFEKELFNLGRSTYLNFSIHPISLDGAVSGLSCFVTDISARKTFEILLTESEMRYSELFQFSPIATFVFELEHLQILDVNDATTEQYGYTREEFFQMFLSELLPADSPPIDETVLATLKKSKDKVTQRMITHQKKNGEKIIVNILSNPIIFKGKAARIAMATDITSNVNYINAIEMQNEKLREISWMQSHVIRAPLARIMGLIPLIDSGEESPEDMHTMMQYLFQSARELDAVISNITYKTKVVNPYERKQ